MTHTDWIDNCCQILHDEQEYPTDAIATALVSARCLVKSARERLSYDKPALIQFQSDAVIQMTLNGLKKELEVLVASPACLQAQNNCE